MLRGMVKSRRESVDLYRQGNRPELAAKEEAEIAVIEAFLPAQLDDAALAAAVDAAIAATGAAAVKDMGRVMAALKATARRGARPLPRRAPIGAGPDAGRLDGPPRPPSSTSCAPAPRCRR